jgi:hypothetical protein
MKHSLREIYDQVSTQSDDLTYTEYLTVVEALEWKEKSGILVESVNDDTDLIYWVETVRTNRTNLNEWSLEDFTNKMKETKAKAIVMSNKAMAQAISLVAKFKSSFSVTYDAFVQLGINMKLGMSEVFNTLKEEGIWAAIKSVKGVAGTFISDLYVSYTTAYKEASDLIFGSISKTRLGKGLENVAERMQELVEEHPNLKFILGPIIAYALYYIWTKMVFKGDFIYDFNWSTNIDAFLGNYNIVEIFSGTEGIELLSWFALGLSDMFPTASWLDGELASLFGGWGNHALAILATVLIFIYKKYPHIAEKPLIKGLQNKLCNRDKKLSMKPGASRSLIDLGIKQGVYTKVGGPKCI